MNEHQMAPRDSLVACRDTVVVVDPVYEPLDEVSALVPVLTVFSMLPAVAARRDHCRSLPLMNRSHKLISAIALFYDHSLLADLLGDESRALSGPSLGSKAQFQRLSLGIYREVQLRTEPAVRASGVSPPESLVDAPRTSTVRGLLSRRASVQPGRDPHGLRNTRC